MPDGSYEAFTDNGREKTGVDAIGWAKHVEELGAGEILLTSIDQEGTGRGFDMALVNTVADLVSIPVIACGGAGNIQHIHEVIATAKADAVSVASILHYNFIRHHPEILDDFSAEGNIEFLKSRREFQRIQDAPLPEIKKFLFEQGVACRFNEAALSKE